MEKSFFVSFVYQGKNDSVTWGNTVVKRGWEGREVLSLNAIREIERTLAEHYSVEKVTIMGIHAIAEVI